MNKNDFLSVAIRIFIIFCILSVLDIIYISLTYKFLFENVLKKINNTSHPTLRYWSVLLFYLISSIGFYFFLIRENKSTLYCFLFGFWVYLFYEITNYSIIEAWNLKIVMIDSLWGGVLFSLINLIFRKIESYL